MLAALVMTVALVGGQDWMSEIDTAGWDLVGEADNGAVVIYAQPARTPNSVWVRMEYREGWAGHLSDRALQEIDCGQWRTRETVLTIYSGRNLTGESFNAGGSATWDYPAPNSLSDALLSYHCGEEDR